MPISVEKDTLISVPSREPGGEAQRRLELREGNRPGYVTLHGGLHGDELDIRELREALDIAEREFRPNLEAV